MKMIRILIDHHRRDKAEARGSLILKYTSSGGIDESPGGGEDGWFCSVKKSDWKSSRGGESTREGRSDGPLNRFLRISSKHLLKFCLSFSTWWLKSKWSSTILLWFGENFSENWQNAKTHAILVIDLLHLIPCESARSTLCGMRPRDCHAQIFRTYAANTRDAQ